MLMRIYSLIQLLMIEDDLYAAMDQLDENDPEGYMYMNFINDVRDNIEGCAKEHNIKI